MVATATSHRFKKGQSGNPGGKPKGTKNPVIYVPGQICKDEKFNPFLHLIHLARNGGTERIQLEATIELCSYVGRKLKPIDDDSGEAAKQMQVTLNIGNQQTKKDED